ncbi:hypothetical protein [Patiriisocius marinus]|uniref:Uncharacterized protein n=1 Tax=Patiriisocius marinus TaxID=1397112 RepID=A0A5J4J6S9_9FLAO|nr:hypothetical protein [Patiriisocius marinus]GER60207.1 hypothetical protein ULMA_23150 [Patiriisocius marinus]
MATKKANKSIVETTTSTVLGIATKANNVALNTTEKAFTKSFSMAEKCIGFSSNIIKRSLQISASQQDLVFDVLESVKKKIIRK